jgi:hypothetical protein
MMSPDGKWVWDGQKWIPVAVHESVFPAYNEATAAAAEPATPLAETTVAATMVEPPVNPFAGPRAASPFVGPDSASPFASPPPASPFSAATATHAPAVVSPPIIQPTSYTRRGATPPWQAWAAGGSGRSRTMYMGAAFIAVAIGVILLIYFGLSQLPFLRTSNDGTPPNPSPAASATPELAVRSDFAIAQRYITSNLSPHIQLLQIPMTSENQACNGTLSFSCQQGLQAMQQMLPNALVAFDAAPPSCIARQVAKVQADLLGIQAAVNLGLKAYTDNNRNELITAIHQYNASGRPFQADIAAVSKAQAACDGQAEGP